MNAQAYAYSPVPTRNPFRWLLACWRVGRDLTNTNEAAIVEIGFCRSRIGRRFAGWENVTGTLQQDPEHRSVVLAKKRLGPIDLTSLSRMPVGSLGATLAKQCKVKGIDPNLVDIPASSDSEFVMAHVFETHDIWHVVTGWGNDEIGEVGLGGFYLAQLKLPLIALMLSLILLNTVFRNPGTLEDRIDAFVRGYEMGKQAKSFFGLDWRERFEVPLADLREELGIACRTTGEGIALSA